MAIAKPMNDSNNTDVFIPAKLDELELTPAQFRVFCHVCRRGDCYERLENMARKCRLHRDTVIDCLRFLVAHRMLTKEKRSGFASIYRVTPLDEWIPPGGNEGVPETKGHPSEPATPHMKPVGAPLPETKGHKGNPNQGSPDKALNGNALSQRLEEELWGRIRATIPDHRETGDLYRTLMHEDPGKFERVLADTENAVREQRIKKTPGAYFMDTWKRFR